MYREPASRVFENKRKTLSNVRLYLHAERYDRARNEAIGAWRLALIRGGRQKQRGR